MVPDIGAGGLANVAVVRHCYDLGITYFDTDQKFGTERFIAAALSKVRHKVVITTKSEIQPDWDRQKMMEKTGISKTTVCRVFRGRKINPAQNP